jgi:hypothetical protein
VVQDDSFSIKVSVDNTVVDVYPGGESVATSSTGPYTVTCSVKNPVGKIIVADVVLAAMFSGTDMADQVRELKRSAVKLNSSEVFEFQVPVSMLEGATALSLELYCVSNGDTFYTTGVAYDCVVIAPVETRIMKEEKVEVTEGEKRVIVSKYARTPEQPPVGEQPPATKRRRTFKLKRRGPLPGLEVTVAVPFPLIRRAQ